MVYPVIIKNSFDEEVPVFLCDSEESAKDLLKQLYEEEVDIQVHENEWNLEYEISEDGYYAKIETNFYDGTNITEYMIGSVREI